MIEEHGTVIGVEADAAWVETKRRSTCDGCSANKGCGVSVLGKVMGNRAHRVRAVNRAGAVAGDRVILGLDERALLRGSLAVYAVPLLAMLAGALVGEMLGARFPDTDPQGVGIVCGLIALAGGLAWTRRFARRVAHDDRYQPVVLRRLA